MKSGFAFAALGLLALSLSLLGGCSGVDAPASSTSHAIAEPMIPIVGNSPSPPPKLLYVDHNGTFFEYALPLSERSKPIRKLVEAPGFPYAPQIAVDPLGRVAVVTSAVIRLFYPPIVSFEPSKARLTIPLTPAITEIGTSGADLVDAEFDPNANLWLFSGLGGEITELVAPLSPSSVAAIVIPFGAPGTKTGSFGIIQGRFDVNATLYIYGGSATSAQLFKVGFPYAKPPAPMGLNVAQADFVDQSQFLTTFYNPVSVILGQYFGPLASPPPQKPPPLPQNLLSQFAEPLNPVTGLYPDATVDEIVGALTADAPELVFFTIDAGNVRLSVYPLPLPLHARPSVVLPCLAGAGNCDEKPEHLFLAP